MKKIIKRIIILFLIISCQINVFAAISIADGTSLTSKAEYSADLSHLSNRLSILENSIDSKIDSLVSAYINNNGIWSGYVIPTKDYSATINLGITQNTTATLSSFMRLRGQQTLINGTKVTKSGLLLGTASVRELTHVLSGISSQGEVALLMFGIFHQVQPTRNAAGAITAYPTFSDVFNVALCMPKWEFATGWKYNTDGKTDSSGVNQYFNMVQESWKFYGFIEKEKTIYFDLFARLINKTGSSITWSGSILDNGKFFATAVADTSQKLYVTGLTIY